jgi:hypothetical protein
VVVNNQNLQINRVTFVSGRYLCRDPQLLVRRELDAYRG